MSFRVSVTVNCALARHLHLLLNQYNISQFVMIANSSSLLIISTAVIVKASSLLSASAELLVIITQPES